MNPDALERLGLRARSARRLGGGDTATCWRVLGEDGDAYLLKLSDHPAPGMFPAEAAGLRWLSGHVKVPDVVAVDEELLLLRWLDGVPPTAAAAAALGAALARMHNEPVDAFGQPPDGPQPSPQTCWVGRVAVEYGTWDDWPTFYAEARLRPVAELARARAALDTGECEQIERLCRDLTEGRVATGPRVPPSRIHGDLWAGNLLWTKGGVALIDPSAHGGHPETDLAMLHLFGAPYLTQIMSGYESQRQPGRDWTMRMGLHQVFPLLVHAAIFAGGYGEQAASAARSVPRTS